MKKSVYTFLAALFLLFLHPQLGHAERTFPLFLNGNSLASGENINGTTMVPIRIISEQLGAKVGWDDKEKKVFVTKNVLNIELQINNKDVKLNGKLQQLVEAPSINEKGTALLPLRFLAENLGLKVTWNEEKRSVYLAKPVNDRAVIGGEAPAAVVPIIPNQDGANAAIPDLDYHDDLKPIADNSIIEEPSTEIELITSEYDQVTVRANGDLHPTMFYLSSPDRLVVDFQKSTLADGLLMSNKPTIDNAISSIIDPSNIVSSDTNKTPPKDVNYSANTNGFAVTSSVYIDKVRYANFSDKPATVRVVIDLKQKNTYELVEDKENHVVIITQKAPSTYTVVLDAGHGGKDTGAISINKRLEKDFNLAMVLKIQQLLAQEPKIQVVLTRKDDTFVELDDRAAIANNLHASLFVAIHGNSYTKTSNGTETYYYRDESLSLAKTMHPFVVDATGFSDKKVKKEKFRVVATTNMPAILCEIGYLSNPTEETEMYKDEFQNRVAASIVAGIKAYLHIS